MLNQLSVCDGGAVNLEPILLLFVPVAKPHNLLSNSNLIAVRVYRVPWVPYYAEKRVSGLVCGRLLG